MRLRKDFHGLLEEVSGKNRSLVRFQGGCEKYLALNQLTAVTVDSVRASYSGFQICYSIKKFSNKIP